MPGALAGPQAGMDSPPEEVHQPMVQQVILKRSTQVPFWQVAHVVPMMAYFGILAREKLEHSSLDHEIKSCARELLINHASNFQGFFEIFLMEVATCYTSFAFKS